MVFIKELQKPLKPLITSVVNPLNKNTKHLSFTQQEAHEHGCMACSVDVRVPGVNLDRFSRVEVPRKVGHVHDVDVRVLPLHVDVVDGEPVSVVAREKLIELSVLWPEIEHESVRSGERGVERSGRVVHGVVGVRQLILVGHHGVVGIKSRSAW